MTTPLSLDLRERPIPSRRRRTPTGDSRGPAERRLQHRTQPIEPDVGRHVEKALNHWLHVIENHPHAGDRHRRAHATGLLSIGAARFQGNSGASHRNCSSLSQK